MTVNLSLLAGAGAQFFDNNGIPLAGGLVYTYTAGTTTPQAAYTTNAGSIAHANPIVLDSSGRVPSGGEIWLTDAVAYKFVLKTATATTIGTYDNLTGNASGIYATFAASSGSSLVGFIQSGTGAVATTVQARLRQTVSVMDFGAVGDGTTDDTAAITLALNSGAGTVYFGDSIKQYRITSKIIPTSTALTKIFGKASVLADIPALGVNTFILDFVPNLIVVEIEGLTFKPKTTNTTGTASWWNGSFTYAYKLYQAGVHLPQGSKVYNCTFLSFDYCPLYVEGTSSFVSTNSTIVENCYISQNANTSFTGYLINNLIFTNNTVYLGGELTFPSIRNTLIENNIVFLPGTPAIDVGGSAAAPTVEVKISGNIAYGRDGIVVELGASNVTIIDNDCYSTANAPNGNGIGVSTNTGGQSIYRMKISDNRIYRYNDESGASNQISTGIAVYASIATAFSDLEITNNYIEAAAVGIYVSGFNSSNKVENANISNNTIDAVGTDGLQISNSNRINVNFNKVNGSSSRYGININYMTNGVINGNLTQGFTTSSYKFDTTISNIILQSPISDATNESGLYVFGASITGAITGQNVVSTFGAATTGYWYQGSTFINQLPTAGGYLGYVCTATGSPGTWKTYGAISA
jgi:hypothetical protein